ncbi:MAG: hypothetical protein QXT64_07125 [Desulfurococcaceae archaeon]
MIELMARETARKVCAVIREDGKRAICVELLTKVLVYGDSVKDYFLSEFNRAFTNDERRMIKQRLGELMGLRWKR